jgi:hypothetical protein
MMDRSFNIPMLAQRQIDIAPEHWDFKIASHQLKLYSRRSQLVDTSR